MSANKKKLNGVVRGFISSPAAGGIILILASVAAIVVANSPLLEGYESLLKYKTVGLSTEHWVNDGLMAIF
ncbi:Na+/H+ antiporter NhaA, partial [Leptospira interrogans]|uniref:Na+/H+ antiporter NhaA n=2 Tax=Pseudomonadati TaxID=3379134 RepID=UPI00403531C5